jgi:menaquinone-specific isochorismate synthase
MMLSREKTSLKDRLEYSFLNKINSKKISQAITRIEIEIETCDILKLLKAQTINEQFFWEDRETGDQIAGIGACYYSTASHKKNLKKTHKEVDTLISKSDEGVKAFLGTSFLDHLQNDKLWGNFGAYTFIIPQFEIIKKDSLYSISFHYLYNTSIPITDVFKSAFKQLNFNELPKPVTYNYLTKLFSPTKEKWKLIVDNLRHLIDTKKLHKAVLARQMTLTLKESISGHDLLTHNTVENCYRCLFRTKQGDSFISVSPERLFLRQDMTLLTEAIAGTRPRGVDNLDDRVLEQALMNSHKDDEEHQFVLDMIKEKLHSLCDVITETSRKTVLKLEYAQHLYFSILGILKEDTSDGDIMRALHPTPAVGGFPTKEAIDFIALNEPFDRGWYSGALLLIEKNRTEAIVGIRSSLLKDKKLHVFSGAGVVARSIAELEWEELNTKIIPFLSYFDDKN